LIRETIVPLEGGGDFRIAIGKAKAPTTAT
jgi:hypothetical protein